MVSPVGVLFSGSTHPYFGLSSSCQTLFMAPINQGIIVPSLDRNKTGTRHRTCGREHITGSEGGYQLSLHTCAWKFRDIVRAGFNRRSSTVSVCPPGSVDLRCNQTVRDVQSGRIIEARKGNLRSEDYITGHNVHLLVFCGNDN